MPLKDPDARRAYEQKRYAENRERLLAQKREYHARPEVKARVAAYGKRQRTEHPEIDRAHHKKYQEANPEKVRKARARWAKENPERQRAHLVAARERKRAVVVAAKSAGCSDCGITDIRVIQLHAPDGHSATAPFRTKYSNKRRPIGDGGGWSYSALAAELAICVPLCANCHLIRHSTESGRLGNFPTGHPGPQQETLW